MDKLKIDIEQLAMALESQTTDPFQFFFDKKTGEVILVGDDDFEDPPLDREEIENTPERFISIDAIPTHEGFEIMEEFIETLKDSNAKRDLENAIQGRKPFRRFKDTLIEFPEIRQQWFNYHSKHMEKCARLWLEENGIDDFEISKNKGLVT